jgi:hypothetical protein
MSRSYYIWGPKYIGGELNGPDLIAGVELTDRGLRFSGRNPELMLGGVNLKEVVRLEGVEAELMFHTIVAQEVPASLQLVFDNASKEESKGIIDSLQRDA